MLKPLVEADADGWSDFKYHSSWWK
jgi:hypothetical protein